MVSGNVGGVSHQLCYRFTEASLRQEINSFISGLINSFDKEYYFANIYSFIKRTFFEYFSIHTFDEKIFTITDEQKEKFIVDLTKNYTRK
jgi:hypothetical protein